MDGFIHFNVQNPLPRELAFLNELTQDLWWSWSVAAQELFRRINPPLWDSFQQNPLVLMSYIKQKGWQDLARDRLFIEQLTNLRKVYDKQVRSAGNAIDDRAGQCVAYFSLEYGLHESLCIYSGGLGVLAGDYLKTASDRQYPLVAVGLYYHKGYFKQQLDQSGWQTELEQLNNPAMLPLKPVLAGAAGEELRVSVPLIDRMLHAKAWRVDVGNVPLYLLDTDIPDNPPDLRSITDHLYGGDKTMRLRQELLLGLGGFKLLTGLHYDPCVCHMNEGHSSFLSLARIAYLREKFDISLAKAILLHRSTTVFTTHTPVPAGNEAFDVSLLHPYVGAILAGTGLTPEQFLAWGFPPGNGIGGQFSMTIFGCYTARFINGVSKLHGEVAREMWALLWPHHPREAVPIRGITNGVHLPSWVSFSMRGLYEKFLGEEWLQRPNPEMLDLIDEIPDFDFWQAHIKHKAMLIGHVRQKFSQQRNRYSWLDRAATPSRDILHFDGLTVGFARRFATYKRANLLLQEPDRLERLIRNPGRSVQFIFAGKAHPADHPGKELIQRLVQFSRERDLTDSLVFLEDYSIQEARLLVQGVDVWLNNPVRPEEASGTSGMKAAINGVPNCSILDGWWAEGYHPETGWALRSSHHSDPRIRDSIEAESLYTLLEEKIVPQFYRRDNDALPRDWIKLMKSTIKRTIFAFSSSRMFDDYDQQFYQVGFEHYRSLTENKCAQIHLLQEQVDRITAGFEKIAVSLSQKGSELHYSVRYLNDVVEVSAKVFLGDLRPEDVRVELYTGVLSSKRNRIVSGKTLEMERVQQLDDNTYVYSFRYQCQETGRRGLTVRVVPQLELLRDRVPGLIIWAENAVP